MVKKTAKILEMPVVALRGLVIFPGMTLHFDVGRKTSVAALKAALSGEQELFLVTQRDASDDDPSLTGLYSVGVVVNLRQVFRLQDSSTYRVIVEGKYRASIVEMLKTSPYLEALVKEKPQTRIKESEVDYVKALIRKARALFDEYSSLTPKIAPDVIRDVNKEPNSGKLADNIASTIFLSFEEKQKLLSQSNPIKRLEQLCVLLMQEIELMQLEDDIHIKVQEQIEKNQKEYYLREQLKAITEELNDGDAPNEVDVYIKRIRSSKIPDKSKLKLIDECQRLKRMSPISPDGAVIRTYIDRCLALPWGKYTKDKLVIKNVRNVLNKDHYGLKDVKERIVEMLAARALSPNIKGQIICLVGPPGVGKTSIARSLAKSMGRKYARISLGGVRDEAEIRGHRRTYIGAIPGRIINALTEAGSSNPLILLDEVDKLSGDFRGDPASALLEVLDAEQNNTFADHYIEMPFDLSDVLFITTANDRYSIPTPLLDRMEIITLNSYTHEEKFEIAKRHLIPKQLSAHGLNGRKLRIKDEAIRVLIEGYTKEAGVRALERLIAKLCRKTAIRIADGDTSLFVVGPNQLENLVGVRKYKEDLSMYADEVGIVNGLAWTSVGGEMLQVEVAVLEGTGKIELTGSLGEVMKESAKAAISYMRSKSDSFGIDKEFYKNKDIHIHVPEGAVPKDGPSAGITIATALVSALTSNPVRGKVAMTGEITLRGRVLPIGGLKEKTMAAYRAGMEEVLLPLGNAPEIPELDPVVTSQIKFHPVKTIDDVIERALIKSQKQESVQKEIGLIDNKSCDEAPPVWTS